MAPLNLEVFMKVLIGYKNGRRREMNAKVAKILEKKGHLKIIQADEPAPVFDEPEKQPEPPIVATPQEPQASDGLDEMDREQLLKFAEDLEIKIHGRTGDEKIREIIREHTK